MAVDRRFEDGLRDELKAVLGSASGPHPSWAEAPARRRVTDAAANRGGVRRPTTLLIAAALALTALTGAFIAGGGLERAVAPTPSPTQPVAITDSSPSSGFLAPSPSSSVSPAPTASPGVCSTQWSSDGTVDPKGMPDGIRVDLFDPSEGSLLVAFGHPLYFVRSIAIEAAAPPFKTATGAAVAIRGSSFYRLTLRGLTKTTAAPDDILPRSPGLAPGPGGVVAGTPMAELRKLQAAPYSRPVDGPKKDSTEVWIIGLQAPMCLDVHTVLDPIDSEQRGPNALLIRFYPRP